MEDPIISGVVTDVSESKVTVLGVPDRPGISAALFEPLAAANVNVDMIVQNTSTEGKTDISFTMPSADMAVAEDIVAQGRRRDRRRRASTTTQDIAKVSLVGAGMKSSPGIAAKMFRTLADEGVNIEMISTSTIRISVVVAQPRPRAGRPRAAHRVRPRQRPRLRRRRCPSGASERTRSPLTDVEPLPLQHLRGGAPLAAPPLAGGRAADRPTAERRRRRAGDRLGVQQRDRRHRRRSPSSSRPATTRSSLYLDAFGLAGDDSRRRRARRDRRRHRADDVRASPAVRRACTPATSTPASSSAAARRSPGSAGSTGCARSTSPTAARSTSPDDVADLAFSYITLQHCSRDDALALVAEAVRVAAPGRARSPSTSASGSGPTSCCCPLGKVVRALFARARARTMAVQASRR